MERRIVRGEEGRKRERAGREWTGREKIGISGKDEENRNKK